MMLDHSWIIVRTVLPDKPEVVAIADRLGCDIDLVVGRLIRLWIWADSQTEDGNAARVTLAFVDAHVRHEGFGAAMQEVGWLRVTQRGISFVDWELHNGTTAKRRALAARRAARHRETKASRERNAPRATKVYASGARNRERELSIQEKTLEGEKTKSGTPTIARALDTVEFRNAWERWTTHRREIRKAMKPTTASALLKKLSGWGADRAVAAINHSIENGYTGCFEPKGSNNARRHGAGGTNRGEYDEGGNEPPRL